MAQRVALSFLHNNGVVHRNIRLKNIVQVSKEQFVLIDLETAADLSNELTPGLEGFHVGGQPLDPHVRHASTWQTSGSCGLNECSGLYRARSSIFTAALSDEVTVESPLNHAWLLHLPKQALLYLPPSTKRENYIRIKSYFDLSYSCPILQYVEGNIFSEIHNPKP